jgi:glycosyltransferase involved in cell wall biosynthesis
MFKTVFKHIKSSIKYLISIPKKIIVFIALHTNKKFLSFKNKSFLKEDLYINNLELHKEKPLLYFKEYKSEFTSKKITNKEILLKLHNSTINKTPKLTVIMPVYNAERYLDESIEDILNQTLTEFELICIDDSSTDNSLKILKEYAEKDNRITILQQPKMNAGSARNIGIYIAKGEYLMFLDADDRFKSNLLKEMYTQAKNKNLDMCICNANKLNNQTTKIVKVDYFVELNRYPQKAVFNKEDLKENLFLFCTSITWNKIFNKDFIRENKISFQEIERSNDLYFAYYSLLKSKRIAVLNKNLINYRTGIQTNLQSGNDKTPFSFLKALLLLKYNIEKESLFQGDIKQSFINMSINIIHYNIKRLKTNKNKQLIKSWLKNKGFNELELLNHSNNYYLYDNRQKLKEILNI